jgi:hypothetical protein
MKVRILLIAVALIGVVAVGPANATVTITFANGDTFDGDVAGSLAGPFTDAATPLTAEILTSAVAPAGSVVNTVAGQLGINDPGADTVDAFDNGESWIFSWSQNSQFVGIDLGGYSTLAEDFAFSVQSPELVGLVITPGSANVAFNSGTGTFTFDSGTLSDIFTATDLYGSGPIPVIANTRTIKFSFSAAGENAFVQGMSFNLLIPEPSSAVAMTLSGVLLLLAQRRRS